jgi:hypothetical protein
MGRVAVRTAQWRVLTCATLAALHACALSVLRQKCVPIMDRTLLRLRTRAAGRAARRSRHVHDVARVFWSSGRIACATWRSRPRDGVVW